MSTLDTNMRTETTMSRYHHKQTFVDSTFAPASSTSSPSLTVHSRVNSVATSSTNTIHPSSVAIATRTPTPTSSTIHIRSTSKPMLARVPTLAQLQDPIKERLVLLESGAKISEDKLADYETKLAVISASWHQQQEKRRCRKILGIPTGEQTTIDALVKTESSQVNSSEAKYATTTDRLKALASAARTMEPDKKPDSKWKCVIL